MLVVPPLSLKKLNINTVLGLFVSVFMNVNCKNQVVYIHTSDGLTLPLFTLNFYIDLYLDCFNTTSQF